jgi:hypothetical protein
MSDDNQNEEPKPPAEETSVEENSPFAMEEVPVMESFGDVSLDEAMAAQAKKEGRIKKEDVEKIIKYGVIGIGLLLILLMVYSCQPKKGSMGYGICSAFLELNTTYPQTLEYTDVEFSNTAVRIYFSNIDAFGEFKHEMIECTFVADAKTGVKLSQVKRNRNPVDSKTLNEFNPTIPAIMNSEPYLVLPPEWENQLRNE